MPLKTCPFGEYLYKVLEIIAKFNESIIELWDRDFSYKGRDYAEGKEWEVSLNDIIEFRFSRSEYCNFVLK